MTIKIIRERILGGVTSFYLELNGKEVEFSRSNNIHQAIRWRDEFITTGSFSVEKIVFSDAKFPPYSEEEEKDMQADSEATQLNYFFEKPYNSPTK